MRWESQDRILNYMLLVSVSLLRGDKKGLGRLKQTQLTMQFSKMQTIVFTGGKAHTCAHTSM